MCYSNQTIVNMYTYYRKLVYKIIVNRGGQRITYFVDLLDFGHVGGVGQTPREMPFRGAQAVIEES